MFQIVFVNNHLYDLAGTVAGQNGVVIEWVLVRWTSSLHSVERCSMPLW